MLQFRGKKYSGAWKLHLLISVALPYELCPSIHIVSVSTSVSTNASIVDVQYLHSQIYQTKAQIAIWGKFGIELRIMGKVQSGH